MRLVTFIQALLPLPALAQEAQDLLCEIKETRDQQPFGLRLYTPSDWGQPVHCVEAPGFGTCLFPAPPRAAGG